MDNNDKTVDLDLTELTVQDLQTIQTELQEFLNTSLYKTFLRMCRTYKSGLTDLALKADLKGVESLFTREQLFGESLGWSNMQDAFTDLLVEVTETINTKHKPAN